MATARQCGTLLDTLSPPVPLARGEGLSGASRADGLCELCSPREERPCGLGHFVQTRATRSLLSLAFNRVVCNSAWCAAAEALSAVRCAGQRAEGELPRHLTSRAEAAAHHADPTLPTRFYSFSTGVQCIMQLQCSLSVSHSVLHVWWL